MARPGLTTHRKFRRLARALGSTLMARGALELMWESAYECGDDYVGTAQDLEALVGWAGEAGALARALADAGAPEGRGFIEPISADMDAVQRYRIHDLWHHAPEYVSKRRKRELERLKRVAPSAKRRRSAPNGGQRPPSPDRQIGIERTPSPSPSPSPSHEKSGSAEASSAPISLLTFEVVGGGTAWQLTDRQVFEWEAAFPGLDVLAESRKAGAWLRANPAKRKTISGMPRFLVAWFTRGVNRGDAARLPVRQGPMDAARLTDWFEECQRLHGGGCGGSMKHRMRTLIDAEKARAS